nr:reverse transcriptase domain-containing protein [Tanacetum cinerariifolium]
MRTRSRSRHKIAEPLRIEFHSQEDQFQEDPPVATMTDNRTMAEMLRVPTEGYAEAIVVLLILAEQFELKHSLINMMTSESKKIKEEQAANARYWKIPACCDDDDDYNSAITPNEPVDSLNIGDEHLDTISATKSDKFIKSCVENLVPNPSESEGENRCDVPACFINFSNILFDSDYESDSGDYQSSSDEDFPKEIFLNPLFQEEINSMRIDQHPFNAESDLIEYLLNHGNTRILNIKMMGDIPDRKVPIPRLMITRVSNQEKSPDLLSHWGLENFQLSVKCSMMIHGKNIPILDVPIFHFYPPINSSMGELDEVIKSSVEDLVPIPSEFEGIPDTMCDVHLVNNSTPLEAKDHLEIVTNSNDDISSIEEIEDDNLREKLLNVHLLIANIEALRDNPTQSSELLTKSSSTSLNSFLEETNTFHNSLPEFKNCYFDLGEISSGSTTTHSDISLPDYEAFYFDDDHIKEISSGSTTTHSDISLSEYDSFIFDLTHEEFVDELAHIISPPEYDCFYFRDLPDPGELMSVLNSGIRENLISTTSVNLSIEDDHSLLLAYVVWIFVAYLTYPVIPPYLHPFENEDTIFDPGITINRVYSFKPVLSHRHGAFKKFNTHRSHLIEWPMTINGKNTPLLDVLLIPANLKTLAKGFYPPSAKGRGSNFVSENSYAEIESFSPSPIPNEDSDSHMEEIDLSSNPDDPIPSSIKEDDHDSERDVLIREELLDNYSLSLLDNESFHFDIPSFFRPPAKPPDGNTGILNVKMMGDISEQKVPMPGFMITRVSNQEKSPDLLSHRSLEIFYLSAKCPMMIHEKNILSWMFLFSIFTPLTSSSMRGISLLHLAGSQPMLKSSYKAKASVIISIPPLVRGVADVVVEIKGIGKLKTRWSGPFTIAKVFPYDTVELSQANGLNFKVNGHKHYFGGDIPQLDCPDCKVFHALSFVLHPQELHILSFILGIQYPNLID